MIVTVWVVATVLDATVKVASLAPGATVTVEGTRAAAGLLLDSLIAAPPAGATPDNDTEPCASCWLTTEDALTETPASVRPGEVGEVGEVSREAVGDGDVGESEPSSLPPHPISEITRPANSRPDRRRGEVRRMAASLV